MQVTRDTNHDTASRLEYDRANPSPRFGQEGHGACLWQGKDYQGRIREFAKGEGHMRSEIKTKPGIKGSVVLLVQTVTL